MYFIIKGFMFYKNNILRNSVFRSNVSKSIQRPIASITYNKMAFRFIKMDRHSLPISKYQNININKIYRRNISRMFSSLPSHEMVGLPALSPTMETGNIVKWNKKEGDEVNVGDIICEIETDKATVEFEAQDDFYIAKILIPEGTTDIKVGQPILISVENIESIPSFKSFTPEKNVEITKKNDTKDNNYTKELENKKEISSEDKGISSPIENDLPEHEIVGMPALSPTMTSGNIAKFNKKEGDFVSSGDVICEIETDKAVVDFEAQDDFYIAKILIGKESNNIKVGEPIFVSVEDKDDIAAFANFSMTNTSSIKEKNTKSEQVQKEETVMVAKKKMSQMNSDKSNSDSTRSGRIFASPFAKMTVKNAGISVSGIHGTGPNGRIIYDDVVNYLNINKNKQEEKQKQKEDKRKKVDSAAAQAYTVSLNKSTEFTDQPLSENEKIFINQLVLQKKNIPHYHLTVDLNVENLLNTIKHLNGQMKNDVFTINEFIIRASVLSLKKHPSLNSVFMDSFIRQYHDININYNVSSKKPMLLRNVTNKGITAIRDDILSNDNNNNNDTFRNIMGSFTIVDVGSSGVNTYAAIINPNQSACLALGKVANRVLPNDDTTSKEIYKIVPMMTVTLALDHRVVDGANGAQWLGTFKGLVEDPLKMIL